MKKIRIQDDLYTYVNQEKLDELVIPDDMPVAGGFASLGTDVEKLMIGEFNAMVKDAAYPNAHLERACTLFALAKDVKRKSLIKTYISYNKTKIMPSGPITSWGKSGNSDTFYYLGLQDHCGQ